MRFVIDETSWRFDALGHQTFLERFEDMLDLIDYAKAEGHGILYGPDLFTTTVWKDKLFWDLCSDNSPLPIPREVQERVWAIFGSMGRWEDLDSWPDDLDVQISNAPRVYAPSVAWAHSRAHKDLASAPACLVFRSVPHEGLQDVIVNTVMVPLWFVGTTGQYLEYFRWLIVNTSAHPRDLEALSPSAFPTLRFAPDVFGGIKNMSKPYRDLISKITHHLGALSDHGRRIFSGPWSQAPAQFGALGVQLSDENGNTKQNSAAQRQRTVQIDGTAYVCWWHTKLEPDRDRIHFVPDEISQGRKLLIGIMCRHLTT